MAGKIIFIFIVVVALGIGLYIYNAGVVGKGFQFLNTFGNRTSTPPVIGHGPSYAPPPVGHTPPPAPTTISAYEIPDGFTIKDLSPYFHQVRFGGISAGSAFSYGQISLFAYPKNASVTIDVTDWQVKSNRGGEYIPQAVNLYYATGLSPTEDIRLKSGDMLNIYSTSAPVNLRLNKCIGYFPNKTQFNPQLPQNCPYIDRSAIQSFSGVCQSYVMSLGGCQSPDLSDPRIPQNDDACRNYLNNHFTYHSCLDEHQADPDFFSNEVRVWAGASPVDPFHDRVLLLDRSGLLVDLYKY
jgi:hypothetical protein